MIKHVAFCQQIVILGTPKRQDQFLAADGWEICEERGGVTLRRAEQQNQPEVPAFRVHGIGYCVEVDTRGEMLGDLMSAGMLDLPDISEETIGNTEVSAETLLAKLPVENVRQESGRRRRGR